MRKPRCSVFIAISLDGYIARKDGSIDWLDTVARPGEDYGFAAYYSTVDALIIGRRTYETALGFSSWPYQGKRCVVLAHQAQPPKHGEEFHAGPPGPLCDRLVGEGIRHIYVDGGVVISAFFAARLIAELTVSVVPILLGDGTRLFSDGGIEQPLTLVSSLAFDSGLVQLRYTVT